MALTFTREIVAVTVLVPGILLVALTMRDGGDVAAFHLTGLIGLLVGLFLYWHPYRGLGFAPFSLTAALLLCLMESQASLLAASVLAILTLFAWLLLLRPAIELAVEPVLWWMYRIRGIGPGLKTFPKSGPCLVVANHACWFDPLFLAKVLPRPITPMMTSRFYDRPLLKWLVKRVFHAIRVHERALKSDVPEEIRDAIAALDRGECVVIFPEGLMRRTEEKLVKRFGRGVWQILAARPATPVFECWIEGGWGSFCSYRGGKPMQGKRVDFRRAIDVAISGRVVLDVATLAEHLKTRFALMNRCLDSRVLLGLPDVSRFELPKSGDAVDE